MKHAFLRMEIQGVELEVGELPLDWYWEQMYRAMHNRLSPGPWSFKEKTIRSPVRDSVELRLSARVP